MMYCPMVMLLWTGVPCSGSLSFGLSAVLLHLFGPLPLVGLHSRCLVCALDSRFGARLGLLRLGFLLMLRRI